MTENVLLDIRRGVVDTAERAVLSWKTEELNARLARRAEELLTVCLRWPDEVAELIRSLWKRAAANLVDDFEGAGRQVLDLSDRVLAVMASLQDTIGLLEGEGHPVQNSPRLGGAIEELRRKRQEFLDRWPWISEEMIQEARAEYGRGEFQSIPEILDGLPGSNPQHDP